MANVNLIIDGRKISADENQTVLEAALKNGIYIPHLCYHENLKPNGGCRLCVVKQEGVDGVITSCSVKVKEGMVINTKDELAENIRKLTCDFMFKTHPSECSGCPKYGKCQLASISQYVGDTGRNLRELKIRAAGDETNPLMLHEMYRCILCGRCVRVCNELRGVGALKFAKVDGRMRVVIDGNSLKEADCRFCGACVEVCPTGSIRDKVGVFREDLPKEVAQIPCQAECPAHIDIPAYLRAVKEGDCDKAIAIIREKVPFPHALGLVCNNRCEDGCKRKGLNSPVSIRNLKRYAAEHEENKFWKETYIKTAERTGKKVAVIGAGACGLTAAYYLNKKGHDVVVMESKKIPGGHMTSGMPEYRIPTQAVLDEIKVIEESGVRIICNHPISNAAELKKDYDAVLVAIGTSVGKKLDYLPGSNLPQVYSALEVLQAQRLGMDIELGDTVNIIGGGNVAFDVAGTALRMGKKVNVICLEKDASQASEEERDAALAEGAVLYDSHSNEEIVGDGNVTGLKVHKITNFYFDSETRALVEEAVPDSTYVILCDSIVFAAGQVTGLTETFGIELNKFGYPINPETGKSGYKTSVEGIFSAGDVITGTKFLIDAIAGGREVASLMDQYLGGDGAIEETLTEREAEPYIGKVEGFADIERNEMALREAATRVCDFDLISSGFTCEQALCESGRCLQCDLRNQIAPQKFWNDFVSEGGEQ
ncbi:MAG: FAD-dependent oxidoreductase [Lachnospiraceae bacterium]|nr:FAD-dependent oxidoreductase [Lachnospiraceae bacterium]